MPALTLQPTLEELEKAQELIRTPSAKIEDLPATVVGLVQATLHEQIARLTAAPAAHPAAAPASVEQDSRFNEVERQTISALQVNFDQTAAHLNHGLSWETCLASLAEDKEAIPILGDFIARGGQPTVSMEADGEIKWTEAVANVPLQDFKGIPMSHLAYDEAGQKEAPKEWGCRGNAVKAAQRIHPRVKLTSKVESEKLAQVGLVQDRISFPWLHTPDSERGNKDGRYGGLAWGGCSGSVFQADADDCSGRYGARFSLGVKKIEI